MYIPVRYLFCFLIWCVSLNSLQANSLSYYHDVIGEMDSRSIENATFIDFEEKVNNGLKNGVYWIRISEREEPVVAELSSAHLLDVKGFIDGQVIEKGNDSNYPYFKIAANKTAYLRVNCFKEGYIPIEIYSLNKFSVEEKTNFLKLGLYYGFAFMVLVMNLFNFFNFGERTFLYYCLFLFFLAISLFYRDGLVFFMFGNTWFLKYGEGLAHIFVVIGGVVFSWDYMDHDIYLPRAKYVFSSLILILSVSFVCYALTDIFMFFVIGDVLSIFTLGLCWLSSVILWRKSDFAKVFAIGYFLILILGFDFFTSPLLGLSNIGINADFFKIAGVFEMLILSSAVVYRIRLLQKENTRIQKVLFTITSQVEFLEDELQKLKDGEENTITKALLSYREVEILELISKGKTNKEMAGNLNISVNTVKYHTKKLYDKLDISSRKEAIQKAVEFQRFMA